MSLLRAIWWRLLPDGKKEEELRKEGLVIGEGCEILNGYDFGSEPYLVEIGDNVRISSGVKITTHDGGMWTLRHTMPELCDADRFGRVRIGDNCHIGMNAMIMPGVTIGRNCVIGAGAIVTRDVPDGSVAVGVPARVIESIREYCAKNEQFMVMTKHMSPNQKREWLLRRGF